MIPDNDPTLARHELVGTLVHDVIASLAKTTRSPHIPEILAAAERSVPHLEPNEGRAHKQNIAGLTASYFHRLVPNDAWRFAGAEKHLGIGRIDLLWEHPRGDLLIDELKAGQASFFGTTAHHAQARRYLIDGRTAYGPRLRAVRLLCLTDHSRSLLFHDPAGPPVPLGVPGARPSRPATAPAARHDPAIAPGTGRWTFTATAR